MNKLTKSSYDVIIVGAGHNGLIAANYLAGAGLKVLVLERRLHIGGATVSRKIFPEYDAYISEYSYLVSLLSPKIISDLRLRFSTKRRRIASFTPYLSQKKQQGLLVSNESVETTKHSFAQLDPTGKEYERYLTLLKSELIVATKLWPTLLFPLKSRQEIKSLFKGDEKKIWDDFIENPLGNIVEASLTHDAVRGLVFTDGKIGVSTHPDDPTLMQNKTFLYHIIGNGTGEWRIPVGGMGALTRELERVARKSKVTIKTDTTVIHIEPGNKISLVQSISDGKTEEYSARYILLNTAPQAAAQLLKNGLTAPKVNEGSVLKINMLLRRLPSLSIAGFSTLDAFTSTFHLNEGYAEMKKSYIAARKGIMPDPVVGEMYCHSLTDSSILSPDLNTKEYVTLTLFGLDMPYNLFINDNESVKKEAVRRYLKLISTYVNKPIEDYIAKDAHGKLCIEVKSPVDLENELAMPKGNIFHGPLQWPFAEGSEENGMWGVETEYDNIFLCGSGARRGGAVSGISGHNAAMKVFERLKININ